MITNTIATVSKLPLLFCNKNGEAPSEAKRSEAKIGRQKDSFLAAEEHHPSSICRIAFFENLVSGVDHDEAKQDRSRGRHHRSLSPEHPDHPEYLLQVRAFVLPLFPLLVMSNHLPLLIRTRQLEQGILTASKNNVQLADEPRQVTRPPAFSFEKSSVSRLPSSVVVVVVLNVCRNTCNNLRIPSRLRITQQ